MIHSQSAVQRAYEFIHEKLRNGALPPGTRLVTRNLADEIGTSLNPVREALNRLASERLVVHVPGAGMFVHRPDAQEMRDLYGLRAAIESHAAAEAAEHISTTELQALGALCEEWRELAERKRLDGAEPLREEEVSDWLASGHRFHRILVDSARNRLLSRCVTDNRLLLRVFTAHLNTEDVTLEVIEAVCETHAQLVAALSVRDRKTAREIMESVVQDGVIHLFGRAESA